MLWSGQVAWMDDKKFFTQGSMGRREWKRTLGRPRFTWMIILKWMLK